MPIQYRIFEELSLVYAVGSGRVTQKDLSEHLEILARDPRYQPPMKKIVDYRNIPFMPLTPKDSDISTSHQSTTKSIFSDEKCAIVTSNDYIFGMTRVQEANSDVAQFDTGVFCYVDEAAAWLDVEIDETTLKIDPLPGE